MDLTEVRFEELDANSTTLIMRGLNRQTTREMFLAMLCFGWEIMTFSQMT
jgi:hypothetical protein